MLSRVMRNMALPVLVVAVAVVCSCARTRTNTYEIEVTGPTESERVRLLLDGREIAAFPGYKGKATVSLDEVTPFPNAHPPAALTAEFFGPDGWTIATASIYSRAPEWIESELAKGATLPLEITIGEPDPGTPLRVYVDNRGSKQAAKIALGQAERRVAAGEAKLLTFIAPTKNEGTRVRVDGAEVGRVSVPKLEPIDEEQRKYGPRKSSCWLVDVSGQHVYRQRVVVYQERQFSYTTQFKPDAGTTLQSARLHEIPNHQIDYFLLSAPSMVMSQDLGVSRLELVDVK